MAADRTPNDLAAALERSQNSYITEMADGHRSIIVRSKDDELAECYRLMAEAARLLREQAEQIDTLRYEAKGLDWWTGGLADIPETLKIRLARVVDTLAAVGDPEEGRDEQ